VLLEWVLDILYSLMGKENAMISLVTVSLMPINWTGFMQS